MNKQAADLGDKNIPRALLQVAAGSSQLQTLWFREESINPVNTTVEIWSSTEGQFLLFAGLLETIEWTQDGIHLIGEYDSIQKAVSAATSNHVFSQNEEPHEQIASTFKRLIKKL